MSTLSCHPITMQFLVFGLNQIVWVSILYSIKDMYVLLEYLLYVFSVA